ncbi:MAG: NAD(P)/FAD-dependent oxidoreductase [Terracidiphilus sp.]|jgi:oxygen-dependent protoporphyrinogen oxidase
MPEQSSAWVIVVGAGIAGLTAAHFLAKADIRVKVLEASGRVGGRMITDAVSGFTVDCGAQFLSSEYPLLRSIVREIGLQESPRPTSPWNAIVRQGKICRIRAGNPLHVLASGLLGPASWMKLGWQLWRQRSALASLPLNDYSQWSGFDTESISSWANRTLDSPALEYIFEPMLQGFYFQEPEETSLALGLILFAFGSRRARTLALSGGMGAIPEAIAARLDVALHASVRSMTCDGDSVVVATDAARIEAEHVILAIPAHEAKRLYRSDDEITNRLMAVPYSSTINIAVVAGSGFHLPEPLKDVYGLLVPRQERRQIAAICIEKNKYRGGGQEGQLLNILLCHASAMAMMALPDDEIVAAATEEAEKFLPGLTAQIRAARLYRWEYAEPYSQVGRAREIAEYRSSGRALDRRVWLAGDFMSMPFNEGAAESGKWAADAICKQLAKNSREARMTVPS